ncbi:MAG: glycosyltransferase [Bacteroidota bacterium]|nr:glycosyltransferase [Bacteroidota bacterium]
MRDKWSAIIVLNWNNFADTKECIESTISQDENVDIYLIDNASSKHEQEALENLNHAWKFGELVINDENKGFAKAHSDLLHDLMERYDYFFLLNNDTKAKENLLHVLKGAINSTDPDMISCKMINYWDHKIMDNAGHKMLSSGEIIPLGHGEAVDNFNQKFENIGACAGAALYSSKMLKDIGLFDDYFETGYEDAELGLRAFIAGYDCIYEPNAVVYHKMGQSIKKVFNYDYTLKIQCNIFYTYLKLVHWQVIAINFLPWLFRLLLIVLIDIIAWRPNT